VSADRGALRDATPVGNISFQGRSNADAMICESGKKGNVYANGTTENASKFNHAGANPHDKPTTMLPTTTQRHKAALSIQTANCFSKAKTRVTNRFRVQDTVTYAKKSIREKLVANFSENKENGTVHENIVPTNVTYFKGHLANGLLKDKCEVHYEGGIKFSGFFVNGLKHGPGEFEQDGATYIGEYSDDKPIGTFKRIKDGETKLGSFKSGEFVARVIKKIKGMTIEVDDTGAEVVDGKATLKVGDYELECEFKQNEIVHKQKNCLLRKRGFDEVHIGKLEMTGGGSKGVLKTIGMNFFLINIADENVSMFGD